MGFMKVKEAELAAAKLEALKCSQQLKEVERLVRIKTLKCTICSNCNVYFWLE